MLPLRALYSASICLQIIRTPTATASAFISPTKALKHTMTVSKAVHTNVLALRRSPRLRSILAATTASSDETNQVAPAATRKRKQSTTTKQAKEQKTSKNQELQLDLLPRTREEELMTHNPVIQIIGVDEAGRGPLAGPVVAAAAIIPTDIEGIMDSKKLTKEERREELYAKIVSSPNARWAVAIGDAQRIDDINILQATLEAMRNAVQAVISMPQLRVPMQDKDGSSLREKEVSFKMNGCYVVCGINDVNGKPIDLECQSDKLEQSAKGEYYALVDGNKLPKEMPCEGEPMVKGDSREYAIAAASILAKVTRDRLMHEYHSLYPKYDLAQHKGYPTASHMAKVREFGASPIHRRTFAPLKHMTFDEDGNIIEDNS